MRDIIAKLPPETYPLLADYFGAIAADLQRMTNQRSMAEVHLDKIRDRNKRLKDACAEVAHLDTEAALSALRKAGHGGTMAEFYLGQAQQAHARAERDKRNQKIAAMVKDGLSKAEVARRLGVHVQTVYRILKGENL